MIRVLALGGAALLALVLAAAALAAFMPTETVRRAVAIHISAITGQTVTVNGAAKLWFLPTPSVSVNRLEVGGANGGDNVLEAEGVTAKLSLLGLLRGRIEITSIKLLKPHFVFVVGSEGKANWRSGASLLSLFVPSDASDTGPRLGDVTIENGQINYRDDPARRRGEIGDINVSVSWPLIGSSLSGSGSFRLRGDVITFRGSLDRPAALFRRDISPFELSFDTKSIQAKLSGNALAGGDVHLESKLSFTSPSMKALAAWLAPEVQNVPAFGPIEATSKLTVLDRMLTLDETVLKAAGARGEGTLSLAFGATRTSLQGTMDFDKLDAKPLLDMQIPTHETNAGTSIDSDRLGPLDVDMRLSVAQLGFGNSQVQRAALSFFARQGQVEASIGDGTIFGGRVRGRLAVADQGSGAAKVQAMLGLSNIQVDDALRAIVGTARMTGVGTMALDVHGEGKDIASIMKTLDGEGKLRLVSGVVQGFDLTSLARQPDRKLSEVFADSRTGRTSIESAAATFRFAGGIATTDDALIRGTGYSVALQGQIDSRDRTLQFDGVFSPQFGSDAIRALELPFSLRGPWVEPVLAAKSDGFVRKPPTSNPATVAPE